MDERSGGSLEIGVIGCRGDGEACFLCVEKCGSAIVFCHDLGVLDADILGCSGFGLDGKMS